MQNTRKSLLALSLLLITTLICGCASTVGIDTKEKGYAHVEIDGSDQATIKAATIEVFSEEGFKMLTENGDVIRFSKVGSTATSVFYGTTFSTEEMTIEPELTIVANTAGTGYIVHCEVYIMEHLNDGEVKENWRLIKNGHRGYMKLLKKIKAYSEAK